jgi:hypothetical protein
MSKSSLAGWLDRLLRQVHGAVGVRERAGLLAPDRRGQHHVGERSRLRQERVLHDEEEALLREQRTHAPELGQRHGRVRGSDPEEADRALLDVAQHLHHVRGRPVVRDLELVDVPE